ncbi:MAG: hypothetical protein GC181_12530 [Bacteroidetes bacterium]|nr:hypothetical protein [Bacteroidota bacterium]
MKIEQKSNFLSLFILMISVVLFTNGCKRDVPESKLETSNFFKGYAEPENQYGLMIQEAENGNLVLYCLQDLLLGDGQILTIVKTDASGNILSKKVYENDSLGGYSSTAPDGGILICSNDYKGTLLKFDKNGNEVFKTLFARSKALYYSFPYEIAEGSSAGEFFVAASDGGNTGNPSTNRLFRFTTDGGYNSYYTFPDELFDGKVLWWSVIGYEDPQVYYLHGIYFDKSPWSWADAAHHFVVRMEFSGTDLVSKKMITPDYQNDAVSANNYIVPAKFSEGKLTVAYDKLDNYKDLQTAVVVQYDKNLNVLWEVDMPFGTSNGRIEAIDNCSDGGIIVTGSHRTSDSKNLNPFLCKISASGELLWFKKYDATNETTCRSAIETRDGKFLMIGTTVSFGDGKNDEDVFVIKTNKYGELDK